MGLSTGGSPAAAAPGATEEGGRAKVDREAGLRAPSCREERRELASPEGPVPVPPCRWYPWASSSADAGGRHRMAFPLERRKHFLLPALGDALEMQGKSYEGNTGFHFILFCINDL